MQKEIESQLRRGRESMFREILGTGSEIIKSDQIKQAYDAKDELAVEVVEKAAGYIGIASASLINILNPELIIFGGGVMESMGDELIPLIKKSAKGYTMPKLLEACEIKTAKLGDNAGLYGALTLAKQGDN